MIKRALVYAYGKVNRDNTFRAAANFALQHDCELTGVFVTPEYLNYATVYGEKPVNMAQHFYEIQKEFDNAAKASFIKITNEIGCKAQWQTLTEVAAQGQAPMYTDIIFVSQPKVENGIIFNDSEFVDSLIINTGIPVIIIPEGWTKDTLGTHPLLGWKESREAVSAVRHALPLMKTAEQVDIVTVVKEFDDERDLITGVEISAYLSVHGIECKFQSIAAAASEHNESPTLQRHAAVHKRDLIIVGGYGHSRLREIILGGVTRGLIRNSEVPVLLAH